MALDTFAFGTIPLSYSRQPVYESRARTGLTERLQPSAAGAIMSTRMAKLWRRLIVIVAGLRCSRSRWAWGFHDGTGTTGLALLPCWLG